MDTIDPFSHSILKTFLDGSAYGLVVGQRLEALGVKSGQGTLYPALRRLERANLLHSWDGETTLERAGRPRRYYGLTVSGRITLLKMRAQVA